LAAHAFWNESGPTARAEAKTQFLKNVSLTGGLVIASVDVEPSARERVEIAARRVKRKFEWDD
ncbi:MAG: hypothetical protein H0W95_01120, partial [Nocardioidaceae bacterium]|nr:hypothetical protein [Nocardioidaceae bacterium]